MIAKRIVLAIPALACAAVVAACAGGTPASVAPSLSRPLPKGDEPFELDPADFTVDIDNPYWPMDIGNRWTYTETDGDGETVDVVVTVTSETRRVANGVTARVVRDTVSQDGEVVEDTFDWYAQDADGTIWYLGEDTAEFEGGEVASTSGSFEAGRDGALAGVIMPADPHDGMAYRQEYYAGEAEDSGEVLSVDEQVEVPYGHFDQALLTKDSNALEPDALEYKLYVRGIGPVLTLDVSGGSGREELVAFETVDADAARMAGTTALGETYP